jgi:hypothetical protein
MSRLSRCPGQTEVKRNKIAEVFMATSNERWRWGFEDGRRDLQEHGEYMYDGASARFPHDEDYSDGYWAGFYGSFEAGRLPG